MAVYLLKEVIEVIGSHTAFAADVLSARLYIEFDGSHTSTVLPAVALFLQQQLQLIQAVEGRTVLFMVIIKRFEQADHRYSALVFDLIAHGCVPFV